MEFSHEEIQGEVRGLFQLLQSLLRLVFVVMVVSLLQVDPLRYKYPDNNSKYSSFLIEQYKATNIANVYTLLSRQPFG